MACRTTRCRSQATSKTVAERTLLVRRRTARASHASAALAPDCERAGESKRERTREGDDGARPADPLAQDRLARPAPRAADLGERAAQVGPAEARRVAQDGGLRRRGAGLVRAVQSVEAGSERGEEGWQGRG